MNIYIWISGLKLQAIEFCRYWQPFLVLTIVYILFPTGLQSLMNLVISGRYYLYLVRSGTFYFFKSATAGNTVLPTMAANVLSSAFVLSNIFCSILIFCAF